MPNWKHYRTALESALDSVGMFDVLTPAEIDAMATHMAAALQAHEEEVRVREVVLAELVATLVGIKVCAIIDGRPEWLSIAEQIDATLNKVKP